MMDQAIIFKAIILLFMWVPCSESRSLASLPKHRERRDAIHFEDFDPDTVPTLSNNAYGKVPDTDFILQTGLSRNLDDERRNIQPRRVSGFSLINFAPDSASPIDYAATTPKPETTVNDPFTLSSLVTFSNLVERARQRSGQTPSIQPITEASSASTSDTSTPTFVFPDSTTQKSVSSLHQDVSSFRSTSRYRGQNFIRQKKRPRVSQHQLGQLRKPGNCILCRQYRVHAASTPTTTTQPPPTTVPLPQIFTNVETASAYLVTRNVSSTSVVTEATVPTIQPQSTTEALEIDLVDATTMSSRKERQNDEANSPTYDYYYSDAPVTSDYEESDVTRTTLPAFSSTTSSPPTTTTTSTTEAPTSETDVEDESSSLIFTTILPALASDTSDRSARTSDLDSWNHQVDQTEDNIFSGQYFEKNPGQYFEDDAGQYHEENPGQYFEDNPGQYYDAAYAGQYQEVNPGQYHETNPGQYKDNLDVQVVQVKQLNDAQVYNVQSKVENFIIGEYGTISKSDGQTIQGVRYTAVDDQSIDPQLIYKTLQKYFPMVQFDEDER